MAKIRVNNGRGFLGTNLDMALHKVRPGDTIILPEGRHFMGDIALQDLQIVGDGDPSQVVVRGQLELRGQSSLRNLTVEAPHFRNAVSVKVPSSNALLVNVFVVAEPGQKYPALYAANTTVQAHGVTFIQQPSTDQRLPNAIVLERAAVEAKNSQLGRLYAENSTLRLTDSGAETLLLHSNSKLTAYGKLKCSPQEGKRSLALTQESVAMIERLEDTSATSEALCDDSFIEIYDLRSPQAETYLVCTVNNATVKAPKDLVTLHDPDDAILAPESDGEPGPSTIVWRSADGQAYTDVIVPQLHDGLETIFIEEGEYFLDHDADAYLMYNLNLVGIGNAENVILHGALGPLENGHLTIENMTLKSIGERAVFHGYDEAKTTLRNVIFHADGYEDSALLMLTAGHTSMINCTIPMSSHEPGVGGGIMVAGARLNVQDSSLRWLTADEQSQVFLRDCSVLDLQAQGGASINSQGTLELLSSNIDTQSFVVGTGASMQLDHVVLHDGTDAFVDTGASLAINSIETTNGQPLNIERADGSQVLVESPNAIIEDGSTTAPKTTSNTTLPQVNDSADNDAYQPDTPEPLPRMPSVEQVNPLAEIMKLTGLEKVKEQINAFVKVASFNQKRLELGLRTNEFTLHSVFLGNPGTGKTTVARLLADALYQAGAIRTNNFYEVSRKDLVGTTLGESANMTHAVLERALGGVLFIDEAYSLYQENNNEFAKEALEEILAFMENHRDDIAIIFAGYTSEMMDFLSMNPGLKSRIPHQFDFEDYTPEEIASIGYQSLLDNDYVVDEDLYRRAVSQRYRQSVDKSNGRWVRNFNQKLTSIMAERVSTELQGNPQADIDVQTITEQDLSDLVGGDAEAKAEKVDELLSQLDSMIGLDSVKRWVRDLITEVKANQQLQKLNANFEKPTYHMVFEGNPGTGKTTVANIIAQLFYNLGLLESATVKTVDRTDLVGQYIGHTEANTKKTVDEALGGVLFVDEAYQLQGGNNDFGQQAIESLVTRLEDDRDKFVAIFAGYTEEMQNFLGANPGLRSRIPLSIEFPDYTAEEIGQMVVARLQDDWSFDAELLANIAAAAYEVAPSEDRANGRWARNFCDRVVLAQKRWIVEHGVTTEKALVIDDAVLIEVGQKAGVASSHIFIHMDTSGNGDRSQ